MHNLKVQKQNIDHTILPYAPPLPRKLVSHPSFFNHPAPQISHIPPSSFEMKSHLPSHRFLNRKFNIHSPSSILVSTLRIPFPFLTLRSVTPSYAPPTIHLPFPIPPTSILRNSISSFVEIPNTINSIPPTPSRPFY